MVAVCLDCFENLRNQFLEYSKRGFPLEKREYKWMQVPLPPDEMTSHLSAAAQDRLMKAEHNPVSCS